MRKPWKRPHGSCTAARRVERVGYRGSVKCHAVLVCALAACRTAPDDAELDRLHAEALRANDEALSHASTDIEPGFTLTVSGQIAKPAATIGWMELQRIATTHLKTINPQEPDKKTPTDFRGWLVRDVLDRFGALPVATEATAVAVDGFRATVQIADVRAMDMLLAIEADGKPIPRTSGGPIYLVHPHSQSEAARTRYPDRFWSFYVTHLVVGTEAPALLVHGKRFDRTALDQLPRATFDGPVGWKVEWPSEVVHLRGVAVTDVLAAAGVTLPKTGRIVVRGKAPIHRDRTQPVTLAISDLDRCKPLLALEHGADGAPITAKLGGPIALVPCGSGYERAWVTFVEELEVEHGTSAP